MDVKTAVEVLNDEQPEGIYFDLGATGEDTGYGVLTIEGHRFIFTLTEDLHE